MPKQLYEDALADVKKIKEVATADAQRAVLEAVTPRIRELIENELLREHGEEEIEIEPVEDIDGGMMAMAPSTVPASAAAISVPDDEGKVTLDIDALCGDPAGAAVAPPIMGSPVADEYEINLESIEALSPVINASKRMTIKQIVESIVALDKDVVLFSGASKIVRESIGYRTKISQLISRVENTYDQVQESVTDPAKKSSFETKLEAYFTRLNKLQEQTMSKRTKKMMNEEDVTLKLTGLPDDIDLDSVGVDLITGEGDEADAGADGGDEDGGGDDLDLGDLDMGGEGGDEDEGDDMGEGSKLSDDTVVEIDEGMLRREIARMKRLREEAAPSADGHGVSGAECDDFGGGSDEGSPFDVDMPDLSPAPAARPLGESDDQMDEGDDDQMDESDDQLDEMELDQLGEKRKDEEYGSAVADGHETPHSQMPTESISRRIGFEKRLQERAKSRAAALKNEAVRARKARNLKKESLLKKEYAQVARRFNESVDRVKNLSKRLAEAKSLQRGSRLNGGPSRSAESKTVLQLRNKLAETNLNNAKLAYTNKLLQNESLTRRQKAQVIEQLDSAKTMNEAKLVYESLSRALVTTSRTVNENATRKVIGSSSRSTMPASTSTLNEGYEAERWARLAGIK